MKKVIIGIIIAIIFIAGGAGAYVIFKAGTNPTADQPSSDATIKSSSASTFGTVDACSVLTTDIAKSLLGNDVSKGSTPSSNVSTATIGVSNCSYLKQESPTVDNSGQPKISGANLLVQYARDDTGANTNKTQFQSGLSSSEIQKVNGIGDAAFYNPQFKQLHVLKGSNWYIITYYKDSILNSTLESDKEMAQKLQFK